MKKLYIGLILLILLINPGISQNELDIHVRITNISDIENIEKSWSEVDTVFRIHFKIQITNNEDTAEYVGSNLFDPYCNILPIITTDVTLERSPKGYNDATCSLAEKLFEPGLTIIDAYAQIGFKANLTMLPIGNYTITPQANVNVYSAHLTILNGLTLESYDEYTTGSSTTARPNVSALEVKLNYNFIIGVVGIVLLIQYSRKI